MRVSGGGLVARRGSHGLACCGHDVARLGWGVLGQHSRRGLVHGRGLRVLTGPLPTQRHLAELGRQLFSLGGERIMLQYAVLDIKLALY